jgi:hypothetical protein
MAVILDLCSDPLNIQFRKSATIKSFFAYFSLDNNVYSDIDLTGYTAELKAYLPNSTDVLIGFDLTTENGGLIVEQQAAFDKNGVEHPNAWGVTIYVEDSVTAAVTWRKADYRCFITAPSGDVIDYMSGQLIAC